MVVGGPAVGNGGSVWPEDAHPTGDGYGLRDDITVFEFRYLGQYDRLIDTAQVRPPGLP